MTADWLFVAVASLAIILVGLAKGGFAGLGAAAMPLLVLVMDPIAAAAMLLPILIAQDAVGLWAFRRDFDWRTLLWMIPGATIGILAGWLLAASVDGDLVRVVVGMIAVVFGLQRLAGWRGDAERWPQWLAAVCGAAAGFTSHMAHAGGPPFQVWALSRNLPHLTFVGTSTIFFASVNLIKVPAYFALGQLTAHNLRLTLLFMPLALASTLAGVWLVKRIDAARFYAAINLLMVAVGVGLIVEAVI